jgi:hypothetical protein
MTLIEKLKDATKGSRELDVAVRKVVDPLEPGFYWNDPCPPYTGSVDTALTLMPEGWRITHMFWEKDKPCTITIMKGGGVYVNVTAPTPALAICIATLIASKA